MFVQMICKDRNEKEMNELYEVLGLIARREEVQIEDRYSKTGKPSWRRTSCSYHK